MVGFSLDDSMPLRQHIDARPESPILFKCIFFFFFMYFQPKTELLWIWVFLPALHLCQLQFLKQHYCSFSNPGSQQLLYFFRDWVTRLYGIHIKARLKMDLSSFQPQAPRARSIATHTRPMRAHLHLPKAPSGKQTNRRPASLLGLLRNNCHDNNVQCPPWNQPWGRGPIGVLSRLPALWGMFQIPCGRWGPKQCMVQFRHMNPSPSVSLYWEFHTAEMHFSYLWHWSFAFCCTLQETWAGMWMHTHGRRMKVANGRSSHELKLMEM